MGCIPAVTDLGLCCALGRLEGGFQFWFLFFFFFCFPPLFFSFMVIKYFIDFIKDDKKNLG